MLNWKKIKTIPELRALKALKGVTNEQIASKLGLSEVSGAIQLSKIFSNRDYASQDKITKIAKAIREAAEEQEIAA